MFVYIIFLRVSTHENIIFFGLRRFQRSKDSFVILLLFYVNQMNITYLIRYTPWGPLFFFLHDRYATLINDWFFLFHVFL